ncbi:MAG: bifunctional hydroxymethylpyrimidine kinase/phosphomethylpyrimidine kinase [Bacteroidaceae bacterium]|nr:bifunctional hydroxymethylpyrimidine kinase/phosphomethylpyrimidine kinase [Bacteroidaceae bacterium]
MSDLTQVLSITGSDNMGLSGIQADTRTISDLGGYPLTAVTAVTIQDSKGIKEILDLPQDMVIGQINAIFQESHPKVVKVGMVRDPHTIEAISKEIIRCRHIILAPGIINSYNARILSDQALTAWKKKLIPEASLLLIKCQEAQIMLGHPVTTNDEMLQAARELIDLGAQNVLLRGGNHVRGQLTALYHGEGKTEFFTSQNTEGWKKHGVGGALSAAIATRIAMGDSISDAITNAHTYIHSQVVYAISSSTRSQRMADIYNQFMTHIASHYRQAHDVNFYADLLAITPRYLSQVTSHVIGKSPKAIIAEYIMKESIAMLTTSRLTIGEISDRLGFTSQAMFSKFFNSHQKCSPAEFRTKGNVN